MVNLSLKRVLPAGAVLSALVAVASAGLYEQPEQVISDVTLAAATSIESSATPIAPLPDTQFLPPIRPPFKPPIRSPFTP